MTKTHTAVAVLAAAVLAAAPALGGGADDVGSGLRYDQVTFLTAHNAFTSTQEGWLYAQQTLSIPLQLEMGVRGLMLDVHMCSGGALEKECRYVEKPVEVVENECKKVTRLDCKNVTKTRDVCNDVSENVCKDWPWPLGYACKTVTKTVCRPTEYVERVCNNVDDLVCAPVTVTKKVGEKVCDIPNLIPVGEKDARLCHEPGDTKDCALTRGVLCPLQLPRSLRTALGDVKNFLDNNRNAVVTLFFESYVDNGDKIDRAFAESGINSYVFDQRANNVLVNGWPTIAQMRNMNKRLVVFGTGNDGRPGNWDYVVETQYNLAKAGGCEIRGETKGNVANPNIRLLTMNHFYEITPGQSYLDVGTMASINSYDNLMTRVRKCEEEVKRTPNFIALDYFERGDGFRVVQELNSARTRVQPQQKTVEPLQLPKLPKLPWRR